MAAPLMSEAPPVDEPAIKHEDSKEIFDDSNIKAMAAKFKANITPTPPSALDKGGTKEATGSTVPPADAVQPADPKPNKGAELRQESAVQPGEVEDVPALPANAPLSRDHFKRLEQAKESYKTRAKQIESEKAAAELRAKKLEEELTQTKSKLPPNLEEVEKALADAKRHVEENKLLTEQLEAINLERSPRFQNWWKSETEKHLKVAKSQIPAEQREELAKLLMAPSSPERNKQIDDIIEPLPPTSKRLVDRAMESIESLKIEREEALSQGSERWKELQAHEKAERQKEDEQKSLRLQTISNEAVKRAKSFFTAFQPTGDPINDNEISGREAFVRAVVAGKLDEDTMLNIPAAAVEYMHLKDNVIPVLKDQIAKQEALIKQLQGSGTSPSDSKGGGGKPSEVTERDAKEGNSFAAAVKANWSGKT